MTIGPIGGQPDPGRRASPRRTGRGRRRVARRRGAGRRGRAPGPRRPAARRDRPGARSARSWPPARPAARATWPSGSRRPRGRALPSVRRGRATRGVGRGHRPAPAAAAGRRTGDATGVVRGRPGRSRPAPGARGPRIASRSQPRFSSPKATSSSTRSMTSWVEGSWRTTPTSAAVPIGPSSRTSRSPRCRVPDIVAGICSGTRPATVRANVLLPDPDGPTTRSTVPGPTSTETPSSAGRSAPP